MTYNGVRNSSQFPAEHVHFFVFFHSNDSGRKEVEWHPLQSVLGLYGITGSPRGNVEFLSMAMTKNLRTQFAAVTLALEHPGRNGQLGKGDLSFRTTARRHWWLAEK